jgi:hypothetical protein
MHPDSSIFERFEVPGNACHLLPRGELAVEQARRIAAVERARSLHREVAAQ